MNKSGMMEMLIYGIIFVFLVIVMIFAKDIRSNLFGSEQERTEDVPITVEQHLPEVSTEIPTEVVSTEIMDGVSTELPVEPTTESSAEVTTEEVYTGEDNM